MRKALLLTALAVAALLMVPVLVIAYFDVGWDRMHEECSRQLSEQLDSGPTTSGGVSFGWQFDGGFTCTFDDGRVDKSWWY